VQFHDIINLVVGFRIPSDRHVSRAIASWSPVIIFTEIPYFPTFSMTSFVSCRGGSNIGIILYIGHRKEALVKNRRYLQKGDGERERRKARGEEREKRKENGKKRSSTRLNLLPFIGPSLLCFIFLRLSAICHPQGSVPP